MEHVLGVKHKEGVKSRPKIEKGTDIHNSDAAIIIIIGDGSGDVSIPLAFFLKIRHVLQRWQRINKRSKGMEGNR